MIKFKKAFTMVELVMVIVVIAILAAMSIPRMKRDTRIEAINDVLMAMRYAQNTALHDDKHSNTSTLWERSFWRFGISRCSDGGIYYYIGTDANYDGVINATNEPLVDPANGKITNYNANNNCMKPSSVTGAGISPNIFLSHKYGINSVNVTNVNNVISGNLFVVGFDNFGRPMDSRYINSNAPDHTGYMTSDVNITFSFQDSSIAPFTITIPKETGYAYLAENPKL